MCSYSENKLRFDERIKMTALIVLDPHAEKPLMELADRKSTNLHRGILAPGEINLKHTYIIQAHYIHTCSTAFAHFTNNLLFTALHCEQKCIDLTKCVNNQN